MFKPTAEGGSSFPTRPVTRGGGGNGALGLHMRVDRTRHIDSSEPDASGMLDYYYEYDIYRFVEGAECLVARSYTDSPQEAHFLRWELGSQQA
ncbi:MAG: hypothetical protein IPH76_15130 [Xanthomonadales bacterium]|nr:hypothetical protein [Xanthomonadales bacterium]